MYFITIFKGFPLLKYHPYSSPCKPLKKKLKNISIHFNVIQNRCISFFRYSKESLTGIRLVWVNLLYLLTRRFESPFLIDLVLCDLYHDEKQT